MTANYRSEIDRRVKEAGIKEYKNIVMDLISSIEQELGLGFNYSYEYITKNLHTAENLVQVLADWRAKVKEMVDIIPFTEGETDKGDSSETDIEELLKTQEAISIRDITIDNLRKALLEKESVIHQLQASIIDKEKTEENYARAVADKVYEQDIITDLKTEYKKNLSELQAKLSELQRLNYYGYNREYILGLFKDSLEVIKWALKHIREIEREEDIADWDDEPDCAPNRWARKVEEVINNLEKVTGYNSVAKPVDKQEKEIAEEKYTQVIADKEYYKDLAYKLEKKVKALSLKIISSKRDTGNEEVSNTKNKLYRGV